MTSKLSRNFVRCEAKALSTFHLQLKLRHELTMMQTDSGVHNLAAFFFGMKVFNLHAETPRKPY